MSPSAAENKHLSLSLLNFVSHSLTTGAVCMYSSFDVISVRCKEKGTSCMMSQWHPRPPVNISDVAIRPIIIVLIRGFWQGWRYNYTFKLQGMHTEDGFALLRVDKFPYPWKQTRVNWWYRYLIWSKWMNWFYIAGLRNSRVSHGTRKRSSYIIF